jgi:prepilin-type N-terminal cleavage/methylation domain-containing protein
MRPLTEARKANGFTLSEVMITVVIVGILSAVALPNYFRQVQRTKQSEATATLAQIQTIVATYIDEYNLTPTGWKDLSDITAIMTTSGPANLASFESISLPGGNYTVRGTIGGTNDDYFEFTATPVSGNRETLKFNIMTCIDLATGASDLKQGKKDRADKGAITKEDLVCRGVS